MPEGPTPHDCFMALRPVCDRLSRMTQAAPLSEKGRAGLSTLVAVHFFGVAIADQRRALGGNHRPTAAVARELMEMIVEDLAREGRPKLIATPQALQGEQDV